MTVVKKNPAFSLLRIIAVIVVVAGWIASVGFTLYAGHNNRSVFLVILFLGWVSSPFIGLLVTGSLSRRWPAFNRKVMYFLMNLLAIGSVVGYSGVLNPPASKPAFIFLIVPLISWILIVIVITAALSSGRKEARKQ
jgi:hypothetical protein